MKNRKKHGQREEVRKILKKMRKELAEKRLVQEQDKTKESTLHLNDLMQKIQKFGID